MKRQVFTDLAARTHTERVRYSVYVDETELEALAIAAARTRRGRAKRGPVVVVITKRDSV